MFFVLMFCSPFPRSALGIQAAMFEKQVSEISKIKDVFSIPPGIARQLLQHYE